MFAVSRLTPLIAHLRQSTLRETEPLGMVAQPRFLNGVVVGETALTARALLECLMTIERECGRERLRPNASRTLDLDLILYGREQVTDPDLVVPHPRFRERLFVLEPLAELEPDWVDPVSGESISVLLRRVRQRPS